MRLSNASNIFICGMSGCGKSTITHKLSHQAKFARKIVFDYVEEWTGTHYAQTYEEFQKIWRDNFHKPSYTIVVRFPFGTPEKSIQETSARIVTLIYNTGRQSQLHTAIIFEECHFYFPSNYIHPVFKSLFTTGRHAYMNMITNTQRPASVHKLVISQSPEVFIGRLFEANDIFYLKETVGDIALQASDLLPFEFIHYQVGRPEDSKIVTLR